MIIALVLLLFPNGPSSETADNGSLRAESGSNSTMMLDVEADVTTVTALLFVSWLVVPIFVVEDFCKGCVVAGCVEAVILAFSTS